jgi:outer membrane protein assembly factor BamB
MTPAPRRHARPIRRARRRSPIPWIILLAFAAAAAVGAAGSTLLATSSPGPTPSAAADQGAAAVAQAAAAGGAANDPASSAATAGGTALGGSAATGPAAVGPSTAAVPAVATGRFPHGLLIADRGNGRILAVDSNGRIFWQFPVKGSLPAGVPFAADDAFVAPDGKTIVANDEYHQVIYRIDIHTRKVIWQYGHFGVPGSGYGYLHNPDDAYPLANGNIVVADIINCRVLEIAPDKRIVRRLGMAGACRDNAPFTYGDPNGDTPLPDGGLLITEITGSRVVRLSPTGKVLFDIHVPVAYPSDAQLDTHGNVIVVDYSSPGAVVAVTQKGRLLWRYAPTSGAGRLDHPSLGTPLPDGTIVINDDARDRMVVLDPRTMKIVWQYGHTDVPGTRPGYLNDPDGHQPIPANAVF